MAWPWTIPTGSDWTAMGWDALMNRAAQRVAPARSYDGLGSHSVPGSSPTAIQVGFVVHNNEELMVFKASDTVNVGDFIKVAV